jgi:hypothetical protein
MYHHDGQIDKRLDVDPEKIGKLLCPRKDSRAYPQGAPPRFGCHRLCLPCMRYATDSHIPNGSQWSDRSRRRLSSRRSQTACKTLRAWSKLSSAVWMRLFAVRMKFSDAAINSRDCTTGGLPDSLAITSTVGCITDARESAIHRIAQPALHNLARSAPAAGALALSAVRIHRGQPN